MLRTDPAFILREAQTSRQRLSMLQSGNQARYRNRAMLEKTMMPYRSASRAQSELESNDDRDALEVIRRFFASIAPADGSLDPSSPVATTIGLTGIVSRGGYAALVRFNGSQIPVDEWLRRTGRGYRGQISAQVSKILMDIERQCQLSFRTSVEPSTDGDLGAAMGNLLREVDAYLDHANDEEMQVAADAARAEMATGDLQAETASRLLTEVDAHLDSANDEEMQAAADAVRGMAVGPIAPGMR